MARNKSYAIEILVARVDWSEKNLESDRKEALGAYTKKIIRNAPIM